MDYLIEQPRRASSLVLAILLHFNTFYSIIYSIIIGATVLEKRNTLRYNSQIQRKLIISVYVFWMLIECARLRSGRIANVEERVSKLSASVLLSIFPQIPALIYIGYFQEMVFPSDRLLSLWMLILIVVELIISISVLRKLIRMKTIAFYRTCRAEALQLQSTKIKQEADAAYWTKRKMEKSLAVENITMTTRRGVVVLD